MLRYFSKKELRSYNNEDKFIVDVGIPLFEAVEELNELKKRGSGVWYWGKDKRSEGKHGIDILFGYKNVFGDVRHTGILCKVIPITMGVSASKKTSILTIESQINLAWETNFTSPLVQKPSMINDLILMTNKDVAQDVWDYTWKLEDRKYRNTLVWDINRLASMIGKFSKKKSRKI